MSTKLPSLWVITNLVILFGMCPATLATAGPAEDFAEGSKHNSRGDVVTAWPLLQKAADAGHAGAQAAFGELMRKSDFMEEALSYFRKSAAQGNADGQYGLAGMLVSGEGTTQDLTEARKYFLLAAQSGHLQAIDAVATAYLVGGMGMNEAERKSPEALRWIRLSAEQGNRLAMETMANALRTGDYGLDVDMKMAESWTEKLRKLGAIKEKRRRSSKD